MEETEKPKIDQHIRQQNNNYGSGCVLVNGGSPTINIYNNGEKTAVAAPSGELPQELQPEEAQALLKKFHNAGLLDEQYQPVGLSTYEQAVLAREISNKLWGQQRWKPFEILWNISKLAAKYDRAMEMEKTSGLIENIHKVVNDR